MTKQTNLPPNSHITLDALLCACSTCNISQRSTGHYSESGYLLDTCGRANSIRIRYVWTRIFLNLQQKKDTCGQGLSEKQRYPFLNTSAICMWKFDNSTQFIVKAQIPNKRICTDMRSLMGMHQTDQPLISELLTLHEKQNFGVSQAELINVHFFTEFVRENSTRAPRTFPQFHLDPVYTCRLKTQIFLLRIRLSSTRIRSKRWRNFLKTLSRVDFFGNDTVAYLCRRLKTELFGNDDVTLSIPVLFALF